jgi:hypothetical protein
MILEGATCVLHTCSNKSKRLLQEEGQLEVAMLLKTVLADVR